MTSTPRMRPSPAMVVAVVALSFALAGSAIAGTDALKQAVTKSKVKKIAKKQANKVLNQRESGLNVNSAKTATNATNAANVTGADQRNLIQAFATVGDGVDPAVVNFGGDRVTSVAVVHTALTDDYTWTFTGNFSGVEAAEVGALTSTFDSDAFTACHGNNDTVDVTATTVVIDTFCHSDGSLTFSSDPHTVQLLIAG